MKSNRSKKMGGASKKPAVLKKAYKNVALLIAESFNERFTPITLETPRSLLPVVKVPLIDYTLEFLANSGITSVLIFCVSHAEQISQHIKNSHYQRCPNFTMQCITGHKIQCVGDVLRHVHQQNLIEGDFVLVHGDLVSNLKLEKALFDHRVRCETNPSSLVTVVYKRAAPNHQTKSLEDASVVGIAKENRLVYWENDPTGKSVEVDSSLVASLGEGGVHLHSGLMDVQVDICSHAVLEVFTDNFDYRNMRSDFITGILGDELYNYELFTHILDSEYAARVTDLATYAGVTRDIIRRWAHPIVVDSILLREDSSFRAERQYIYRERGVRTHTSTIVGPDTSIGKNTKIGANTVLNGCIVGANCVIGEGVTLTNSFLWDDVVIGSGSTVSNSLLCTGVHIGRSTTVDDGCVISFGVCIGAKITLERETKLTLLESSQSVEAELGAKGKGRRWVGDPDDDEGVYNTLVPRQKGQGIVDEDDDEDSYSEDDLQEVAGQVSVDAISKSREFDAEVREIVVSSVAANTPVDTVSLEINARKFAHDKVFFDCARSILHGFLDLIPEDAVDSKSMVLSFKKTINVWHKLLEKYAQEPEDQPELLWAIQEFMQEPNLQRLQPVFQHIVHHLYNVDIIEEDAILQWAKESEELTGEDRKFLDNAAPLLKWLQEADSDSSSE